MRQTVPTQHPAVVLRSRHRYLQLLLAIVLVAVIGLSVAVGILASHHAPSTGTTAPAAAPEEPATDPRYIHPPGQSYDRPPSPPPQKKGRTVPR
jgi:hypothetical protein